jgi:hypothetical protein
VKGSNGTPCVVNLEEDLGVDFGTILLGHKHSLKIPQISFCCHRKPYLTLFKQYEKIVSMRVFSFHGS